MVDEGLVQYIRERLGEGYKEQEIRAALQGHGHPDAVINEAFNRIHRSHKGNPLIVILILVVLIMVGILIFLLLKPGEPSKPSEEIAGEQPSDELPAATDDIVSIAATLKKKRVNLTADELYYETVEEATTNAKNIGDGILICSINRDPVYKNWCLTELADQQVEAEYCTLIGEAKQRDECYLAIIMQGEDQYCEKLVLEEHKRVCDLLLGE